ncbi:MAG: ISAs1 family transposase [Clostridia bacterium]
MAEKIVQKDGNYVLALKENHPRLLDDVRLYMQTEVMNQSKASLADCYFKRSEKGHGRIETRECYLCNDVAWLEGREQWKKLNGFAAIVTKREEIGQAASTHCDYFIYSHEQMTAEDLMKTKRKHWAIENQLHWMLDVTFREDLSRARIENAAENLNILRKLSLQLLKAETTVKGSMRAKRLRCGYDLFYALKVIGVNGFS